MQTSIPSSSTSPQRDANGEPTTSEASPSASAAVSDDGGFDSGVFVPINDQPLFNVDSVRGVANGNAAITFGDPSFAAALTSEGELESFSCGIALRGALTLELRIDAAGELSGSMPLSVLMLPSLVFSNVIVTPYLAPRLKYSGNFSASARVSFVIPFAASAQFIGRAGPQIEVPEIEPEIGMPEASSELEFSVELDLSLVFMVTVEGLPIGGPALTVTLGLEAHVAALPTPEWHCDMTTALSSGWTLAPGSPLTDSRVIRGRKRLGEGALPALLPGSRWSRVYDVHDSVTSAGLVPDGEGAILIGNSRLGAWPWLAAVDRSGAISWQNSALQQPFGTLNVKSLIRTANGDLLATGSSGLGSGMRVQRYDRSGRPLWSRVMRGPPSTLPAWNGSVASSSGGAILVGHISYVTSGERRCVMMELDAEGAMAWVTEFDLGPDVTNPTLQAVAVTPTGEILAVGTATYQDIPDRAGAALIGANGLVVRARPDGAIRSAFAVGSRQADELTAIAVFPDGQYAVGGHSSPSRRSGLNGAWITCFDAQDAIRWSGTYAGEDAAGYAHVNALAPLLNHGLLVVGGSGTPEQTREAWLFRTNDVGMPVWFKTLDGRQDDTLTHVLALDKGLLAFGYTKSFDVTEPSRKSDLWAVCASVDGMLDFQEPTGMQVRNDKARWRRPSIDSRPLTATMVPCLLGLSSAVFDVVPASATDALVT